MFVSEHYLLARPLWDKTRYGIEMAARYADSLRGIDPFAPSHNVYYIGAYLRPGDYTPHVSPEGDMKVLVARFVHALATDGRFRDLGGVGVSRFWCDEEFARWACDVVRHYAVDGCTDDFAESLGYSYTPGILSNGDFMDGLAGWDARPAETGSLVVTNLPGAAKTVFARIGAGTMGDSFALFTRSASRPNILSRKVSGLVPGRLYSLNYATVDYDEMLKPGVHSTNMAFNAKISNACLVENGSYASFWPPLEWAAVRRPQKAAVCAHKIVFEARADEAELTFSDWRDGSSPGGRIGERLIMNNAGIRPYYKGKEKAK